MAFIKEFQGRGKLSKNLCASFIALISKIEGAAQLKDFRPISLIGIVYKILAKVLACIPQRVRPFVISSLQGAFVKGRQILDGVLVANEFIHLRHRDKSSGLLCQLVLEKVCDRVD